MNSPAQYAETIRSMAAKADCPLPEREDVLIGLSILIDDEHELETAADEVMKYLTLAIN